MTVTPLIAKTCTLCRGDVPPLIPDEVTEFRKQVADRSVQDEARRIERTYAFKNFAAAFAFVRRVAELAEAEDNHPDVSFGWGYATVSLQTQKIQGLQENDFIMAAMIDNLAENLSIGW